jgi:hypothetical protein
MISIQYASKFVMVEISGSVKELQELMNSILGLINSENLVLRLDTKKEFSIEYEKIIEHLEIYCEGDAVKISLSNENTITISGSDEKLKVFASNLDFDDDMKVGYHVHYEYFEGNQYIDSESLPTVIMVS